MIVCYDGIKQDISNTFLLSCTVLPLGSAMVFHRNSVYCPRTSLQSPNEGPGYNPSAGSPGSSWPEDAGLRKGGCLNSSWKDRPGSRKSRGRKLSHWLPIVAALEGHTVS